MKTRYIFFLILGIDVLVLFLEISELSISYHEAEMLYGKFSFLQFIEKTSLSLFGQNDLAFRLPMIILHILSLVLLYEISKTYLRYDRDRLWLMLVFVLLPGVTSSAILVDSAGMIIFGLLLFIYLYKKVSQFYIYLLLSSFVLIDGGFLYLFFSLIFFALYIKDRYFLLFNICAFLLSFYIYGINTQGLPEGYFLDVIGLYCAIFTPIIFIYIFYISYRRYLTKEIDILWFISSITLLVSLLLSFRQRIDIEDFAPYIIVAFPLAAQTFSASYRVRLKMFRTKYKTVFIISVVFLLLNSFIVLFNKYLYLILDEPQKHFAYKMHVAKELSKKLKDKNINCVMTDARMQKRLKFYGISKCQEYVLGEKSINKRNFISMTINYNNKVIYNTSVTKINIK